MAARRFQRARSRGQCGADRRPLGDGSAGTPRADSSHADYNKKSKLIILFQIFGTHVMKFL